MKQCEHIISPGTDKAARCKQPGFRGLINGSMWASDYCEKHEPEVVKFRKVERVTEAKLKRKADAKRSEAKNYIERGGLNSLLVPDEIIRASEQVGAWFAAQGLLEWKLGPCASRRLCDTHEEQLVELVMMLRLIQNAVGGFVR